VIGVEVIRATDDVLPDRVDDVAPLEDTSLDSLAAWILVAPSRSIRRRLALAACVSKFDELRLNIPLLVAWPLEGTPLDEDDNASPETEVSLFVLLPSVVGVGALQSVSKSNIS